MPVSDLTDYPSRPARPLWPAVRNGLKCRCPACGKGKLFRSYLKVADTCENCGTELHHHRADDAPPYLVITIVGHVAVGALMHMEMSQPLNPMIYLWTMIPVVILMTLALLPVTKGAVVGLQWSRYMHGFDPGGPDDDIEDDERT